jgi:enamine deaminase RidA (YjgF/YER057c/UK114 family)
MIDRKLAELGFSLPEPRSPAFDYLPVVIHGNVAYVSGQLPWRDGSELITGKLGAGVSLELGAMAARSCVLQGLSVLKAALGGFDRVERIVKLTGFVASAEGFIDQPRVIDAASSLLRQLLGEHGRHARSAIGVAELLRAQVL